jgi:hypothetical protein
LLIEDFQAGEFFVPGAVEPNPTKEMENGRKDAD